MGFFSSTCAKTHLPVLASVGWGREAPRLCNIVVVPPRGEPYEAVYDGYGLHGDADDFQDLKLVLASDYQGERYEDLGASEPEPNQGYFHAPEFIATLVACPGFASHDAYEEALFEFENGADVVDTELVAALKLPVEVKGYRLIQVLADMAEGRVTGFSELGLSGEWLARLQDQATSLMATRSQRFTELAQAAVAAHQRSCA